MDLRLLTHELGHNLGLYHAHALECGEETLGEGETCHELEYGDTLDVMGLARGHFSAFGKERLGWLGSPGSSDLATVERGGTFVLGPLEAEEEGLRALKVPLPSGEAYYLEYRQALGFDRFLSGNANVLGGVVVRRAWPEDGDSGLLLDMTSDTESWEDPALEAGESFRDEEAGVTITVLSAGKQAEVQVEVGPGACRQEDPTGALAARQERPVLAGGAQAFTLALEARDGRGCPPERFELETETPEGWKAVLETESLTLGPGESAEILLRVSTPVSAAPESYPLAVTIRRAFDPASEVRVEGVCRVARSRYEVALEPEQDAYARPARVQLHAAVEDQAEPVKDAHVLLSVVRPDGAVRRRSGRTSAAGGVDFVLDLGARAPAGEYRALVLAGAQGRLAGSAESSFKLE